MSLSKIEVVLANRDEQYQQCLDLRREVFVGEQGVPESLEIDEFENVCQHFLATENDVPVATGRLRVKNHIIKFERIATSKKHRGLGYGKRLMEHMQRHVAQFHSNLTPSMHAQLDAVGFYQKLGWIAQGDVFYEADIPHRLMIFTLQNS